MARLSWKDTSCDPNQHDDVLDVQHVSKPTPTNDPSSPTTSLTGSLHDELGFCKERELVEDARSLRPLPRQRVATLSRPCHRCVSYMHSAGVKRVFWTNAKGEWEGAKIEELVDALEKADGSVGTESKALFVQARGTDVEKSMGFLSNFNFQFQFQYAASSSFLQADFLPLSSRMIIVAKCIQSCMILW